MADEMLRIAGRGNDGTAKAISTDNNGKVKLTDSYFIGGTDRLFKEVKASGDSTASSLTINLPANTIIDDIIINADDTKFRVRWQSKNGNFMFFDEKVSHSPGNSTSNPMLEQMRYTHPFLKNIVWDESANVYIFESKGTPIFMPYGMDLNISFISVAGVKNIYVGIHYREMEV